MLRKELILISDFNRVKISLEVLLMIEKFLQIRTDLTEAGGVLVGRHILDSNDIVVDEVSIPSKEDIRFRNRFVRKKEFHQQFISDIWSASGGTCNYLGEWHTHPEEYPTPSSCDLYNWKRILRTFEFDYEYLYFLIAGTSCIRVWEGDKTTLTINELKLED